MNATLAKAIGAVSLVVAALGPLLFWAGTISLSVSNWLLFLATLAWFGASAAVNFAPQATPDANGSDA